MCTLAQNRPILYGHTYVRDSQIVLRYVMCLSSADTTSGVQGPVTNMSVRAWRAYQLGGGLPAVGHLRVGARHPALWVDSGDVEPIGAQHKMCDRRTTQLDVVHRSTQSSYRTRMTVDSR